MILEVQIMGYWLIVTDLLSESMRVNPSPMAWARDIIFHHTQQSLVYSFALIIIGAPELDRDGIPVSYIWVM